MASSASPTSGSPAALCVTQASTVVKAASSAFRSPTGAGGSTAGSSSPASTPRTRAMLAAGAGAAGFGGASSRSQAASARKSRAAAARRGKRITLLPSEQIDSMSAEPAMEDPKNKTKAVDLAVASIEKEYGKGAIMRLKDGVTLADSVQVVPTGSIGLDIALCIGGY